jgi:adenylate cyclase
MTATRRLAAILATDVAGYSALMGLDEEGTLARLTAHRGELVDPTIAKHRGRIVKTTGDGMLVEFASVVDAVRCAVELQRGMAGRNAAVDMDQRIRFRIGITVGDIIFQDGDIFGDGVNIAARLEGIAEPGGMCISDDAWRQVQGKIDVAFEDMGEQRLKNIAAPVRVHRVRLTADPPKARLALALPDRPSIAVLPFQNMSGDPEQDFFADGMVEDIITALSRMKWLFVIARNSSFTYKGRAIDIKQIGRDLGVRYVLEGSVRKSGTRARITAQLIDASTGAHLWAERHDGAMDDIFAIQDTITSRVAISIGPELMSAELARANLKPQANLDAWDCGVRALFLCQQLSESGSAAALVLLDRALALDPDYHLALGLKAWTLLWRAFQGWHDMGDALTTAGTLVAQATNVESDEPWIYLAKGMIGFASRDTPLTIAAIEKAVSVSPNFAYAHGMLGAGYSLGGDGQQGLRCLEEASRLNPREVFHGDLHLFHSFGQFQTANYAAGLQVATLSHQWRQKHPMPLMVGLSCAGHLGDVAQAATLLRKLQAINPGASLAGVTAINPYVKPEDQQRLIEGLRKAGLPE